jgi:hypothetical protein
VCLPQLKAHSGATDLSKYNATLNQGMSQLIARGMTA